MDVLGPAALAFGAALLGSLGGLGGAILLVPLLVVTGMAPAEAAPLGLIMVAASSVAAAPRQLVERSVNHRLGVTIELLASAGAVVGAIVSSALSETFLTYLLATVAALAALAGAGRSGLRNLPDPECDYTDVGERVGAISGAYVLNEDEIVPYRPTNLRTGLVFMALSGFVAGSAGASGGFIKTPAMNELMKVPTRVAASTTTFTVGITASAALVIYAIQGRIDVETASLIVSTSLLGGVAGAAVQSRLPPAVTRRVLSRVAARDRGVARGARMSGRDPIPSGSVSSIRGRVQAPALTWLTRAVVVVGVLGAVLPGDVGIGVATAAVGAVVAAPLLRVLWLVFRWSQEDDRRFIAVGLGLLGVIGVGALLSALGVGG